MSSDYYKQGAYIRFARRLLFAWLVIFSLLALLNGVFSKELEKLAPLFILNHIQIVTLAGAILLLNICSLISLLRDAKIHAYKAYTKTASQSDELVLLNRASYLANTLVLTISLQGLVLILARIIQGANSALTLYSCLLMLSMFSPLNRSALIRVALFAALNLGAYGSIRELIGVQSVAAQSSLELIFFLGMILALTVKAISSADTANLSIDSKSLNNTNFPKSRNQLFEELIERAKYQLAREYASELAWRVPLVLILGLLVLFGPILFFALKTGAVLYGGFGVATLGLITMFVLSRAKTLEAIDAVSLLTALVAGLAWIILLFSGVSSNEIGKGAGIELYICAALAAQGLLYALLPIRQFSLLILFLTIVLAILLAANLAVPFAQILISSAAGLFLLLPYLLTAFVSLFAAKDLRFHIDNRVGSALLVRAFQFGVRLRPMVRLLGFLYQRLAGTKRALVLFGHERAELIDRSGIRVSNVDSAFLKRLHEVVQQTEESDCLISIRLLGEQFYPLCLDWFGYVPSVLYASRLESVSERAEQQILVLLPWRLFIARRRLDRSFRTLAGLVRLIVGINQSHSRTSDDVLAREKLISEKEEEFSQIVHSVNNSAQDIAIVVDQLKERVSSADSIKSLEQLEGIGRILSTRVSDLQWLRELGQLSEASKLEPVLLAPILEEFIKYGSYYAEKKGEIFSHAISISPNTAIKVVSREFLEAGLRLVLRFCSRRFELIASQPETQRKIALRVQQKDQKVQIIILDQAAKFTSEQFQLWLLGQDVAKGVAKSESSLKALQKLASLSNGSFFMHEQQGDDNEYNNGMVLEFDSIKLDPADNNAERDGWALLVDDRLEMTAFYAKVAEVLEVHPERASSVQEAREIIIKRGMPKIVVSDIELGQESGLDLVREIRAKFGSKIPIIVVSGHNDADIASQAISAGATKYLAKPVGRNRLFNEIKALLG